MYLSFKVHISLWLPTFDLSIKYVCVLSTPDNLNLLWKLKKFKLSGVRSKWSEISKWMGREWSYRTRFASRAARYISIFWMIYIYILKKEFSNKSWLYTGMDTQFELEWQKSKDKEDTVILKYKIFNVLDFSILFFFSEGRVI